jgi:hypothetical protein
MQAANGSLPINIVDALLLRWFVEQHAHNAAHVLALAFFVESKAPRPAVDFAPARVHRIVEGLRLEPAVGVKQRHAFGFVAGDDVVLIVGRQRGQVVVAEDRPHREVRQESEFLALHRRHDAEPASDRAATRRDGSERVVARDRVGRFPADLSNVGQFVLHLDEEQRRPASANPVAEGAIPDRSRMRLVKQPCECDREEHRVALDPLSHATAPRHFCVTPRFSKR